MQAHASTRKLRALFPTTSGLALGALALAPQAGAQVRFSIDWNGPTVSVPECATGMPITEGDILMPCAGVPTLGPLAPPRIAIPGGVGGLGLGLHAGCVGHPGGTPCGVEVDALSFGRDYPITQAGFLPGQVWWSTDEYSAGIPGSPVPPNVLSEYPCGDASADMMLKLNFMPPVPNPPFIVGPAHRGVLDGDGLTSCTAAYMGLGMREPNLPSFAPIAFGDNLDAFDDHTSTTVAGRPFFSLDASFVDPCSGVPNSGSALAHGFRGGDILTIPAAGGAPFVWAPAVALGLDFFGTDSDDLDALAIFEDGDGVFDPTPGPYGWGPGSTDMVLYSVRRGSAVIGMPDSFMGIPIEPGDILMPPIPGGASPFPAIFVSAENLGLGCVRTGTAFAPCGFSDELDALDTRNIPFVDCNSNGVEDVIDIALGTSLDANLNGIPDECESVGTPYCFCPNGGICLNPYIPGGCQNSTGVGAILSASGSGSVFADDLVVTATQMPPGTPGLIYRGTLPIGPFPFGDGLRCVGGNVVRFSVQFADATGCYSEGPGIVAGSLFTVAPIVAPSTWYFQAWYRDPFGPCATTFNLSNALQVNFF